MYPFRFDVSLRFFGSAIDVAEISQQLKLEPKWKRVAGAPRMTPAGVSLGGVYETSYCSFRLTRKDGEELFELLGRIVDDLLPHQDLFQRIREGGGRSEFFVGWYSPSNSGNTFGYELLAKLGELRIDLALDVYAEQSDADPANQCS